eukprot:4293395-Pyramimonas_sp.AAC.1
MDEPRRFLVQPLPGCARRVACWARSEQLIEVATDADAHALVWGQALVTTEQELMGRDDALGAERLAHAGRSGPTRTKTIEAGWAPPAKRRRLGPTLQAWLAASRWARHLIATRATARQMLPRLRVANAACELSHDQLRHLADIGIELL